MLSSRGLNFALGGGLATSLTRRKSIGALIRGLDCASPCEVHGRREIAERLRVLDVFGVLGVLGGGGSLVRRRLLVLAVVSARLMAVRGRVVGAGSNSIMGSVGCGS